MSKQNGGLFSEPRGSVGGVTFGAARTRTGKVTTARAKSRPSNPRTPAQVNQRSKFKQAQDITRAIGPTIYQTDWNRSVGQLPGYNSLQSIFMNNLTELRRLGAPSDTPLGNLQPPQDIVVAAGGNAGEISVAWVGDNGPNGTDADVVVAIAVPSREADREVIDAKVVTATRIDQGLEIEGMPVAQEHVVCVYARGAGDAEGKLSLAQWFVTNSGA